MGSLLAVGVAGHYLDQGLGTGLAVSYLHLTVFCCPSVKLNIMEGIKNFLESSSIHGLTYISTSVSNVVKLFWIAVVTFGFFGASLLIYQAFQDWDEVPVTTAMDTEPIAKMKFPKVTVCPPKNTYTNLNYDLMTIENMTIDNDTRNELANFAVEQLYDYLYDIHMANMSKFKDDDRYYKWYNMFERIQFPGKSKEKVAYWVQTHATSGTISTQYFGEKFDARKVEINVLYRVQIYPPKLVRNNSNVTLHLDIETNIMTDLSTGASDKVNKIPGVSYRKDGLTHISRNCTPPKSKSYYIQIIRNVSPDDAMKQKLKLMPGFKITWYYSGIEVEPEIFRHAVTNAFVRKDSAKSMTFFVLPKHPS